MGGSNWTYWTDWTSWTILEIWGGVRRWASDSFNRSYLSYTRPPPHRPACKKTPTDCDVS